LLDVKSRRAGLLLMVISIVLSGCSGNLSSFSFGKQAEPPPIEPNLYPAKYREEITAFMRTYLANPVKVKDAFVAEPVLRPVAGTTHYITCIRYNPRDSKNQYLGVNTRFAIFLGGKLNQLLPEDPQLCAGLNYQRYPELEAMVP
jgi:hypothetical protein